MYWFQSYLHERQQSVEIGDNISKPATITCGVPQGSIHGMLLFLIYVNVPSVVGCKLPLYADDSAIIVSGTNTEEIQNRLSSELESIR